MALGVIVAVLVWLGCGMAAAGHAIMYKRDPRAAALWTITSLSLPLLGPLLYLLLGVNRIHRQARRYRPYRIDVRSGTEHPVASVEALVARRAAHLRGLLRLGDRAGGRPLVTGSALEPLFNGEQAYPAMLAAIAGARRSVNLCTYIFDSDEVGDRFVEALGDAVRRGVEVRVLVDGVGTVGSSRRLARRLSAAGVRWTRFLPFRSLWPGMHLNLRNHRKLLIVDGRLAFTGGMNISARYLADREANPHRVRDLHFRVRGPIVTALQEVFAEDWGFATAEVLEGGRFFTDLPEAGSSLARVITDGPDEDLDRLQTVIFAAIASAAARVEIMTPYFIPNQAIIAALVTAALRGAEVVVILPGCVDWPFMHWAAVAYLWELLRYGVRVFFQPPPFVHTKLMVIDGVWSLVGSANLDPRSLRLNFELDIEAYDPHLAGVLSAHCDTVRRHAREVHLADVDSRPAWVRLRDGMAKLFSPYL